MSTLDVKSFKEKGALRFEKLSTFDPNMQTVNLNIKTFEYIRRGSWLPIFVFLCVILADRII